MTDDYIPFEGRPRPLTEKQKRDLVSRIQKAFDKIRNKK
jgi:hypothetical protein